jgi:TP53 regulating kinase-like protein
MLAVQKIWEGVYLGRPTIVKQRFRKKYRHSTLDNKLTLSRLKQVYLLPDMKQFCLATPALCPITSEAAAEVA